LATIAHLLRNMELVFLVQISQTQFKSIPGRAFVYNKVYLKKRFGKYYKLII